MSKAEETVANGATVVEERYPLKHKGFGKYEVNGVLHANKDSANAARAKLLAQLDAEDLYGDIVPPGVEIKVHDRSLVFRGSVLEVPMNEVYLPDGDYNPTYDRAWYYAWAARRARSVSSYEAMGYQKFTYEELKAMVDDGSAPAHYLSLLQRDGDYLVYGDLILMRTPRVMWRQRKAKEQEASEARVKNSHALADQATDALGLQRASGPW